MTPNLTNLLLSLASAMAPLAGCTLGTDLYIHQLPASASNGDAAVLRIFGGPTPNDLDRQQAYSVQCMAMSPDAGASLSLAQRLYEALHFPTDHELAGRPRCNWSIAGKKLNAAGQVVADGAVPTWLIEMVEFVAPPGSIGADESGRVQTVFNFDVYFSIPEPL